MFRKPKNRNIRQRQTNADEDEEDNGQSTAQVIDKPETVKTSEVRNQAEDPSAVFSSKNILSFDHDEDDDVGEFKLKRISKTRDEGKRRHQQFMKKHAKELEVVVKEEIDEEEVVVLEDKPRNSRKIETDSFVKVEDHYGEIRSNNNGNDFEHEKSVNDDELRDRFPSSFTDIPDAKAVFEARKKREMMRATGAGVQPVIPLTNSPYADNKHAQRSRLIREDDNDLSDEENDGFISSKSLLINEEEQRRNEQLEALKLEQGGSDDEIEYLGNKRVKQKEWSDDEMHYSSDDETERWERDQIRKAVGQRKVAELNEEVAAYRKNYHDPNSVMRDRIVDEDMDIEVVSQQSSVPSFLNSSDGTLKRPKKYSNMEQLLEKLEISITSRKDELRTNQYQIEQYTKNVEENRESITKMAEANIKMERDFQLYQEMKFYTDTVLNCLNEKILLINEIETEIFDLWKTRANDLARRRAEDRNRRRFDRHRANNAWNSDAENTLLPDTYVENMARLLERVSAIFEDTATEYCDVNILIRRFIDWFQTNPISFRDAYVVECIPKILGPFVRVELFEWNPLFVQNKPLHKFNWYQAILSLGFNNEGIDIDDPAISGLIPDVVEKIVLPKITKIVSDLWDPMSVVQTQRLIELIDHFVSVFPNLNRDSKFFVRLLNAIRQSIQVALKNETEIPYHLTSLVTEIKRERQIEQQAVKREYNDLDDMQALLAQSQSILK